jgi:hypothetical protein
MPDNPFSNPAFSAMGGQLVQMWQKSLESWWSSLLDDSGRLGELARRLAEVGYGGGGGEGDTGVAGGASGAGGTAGAGGSGHEARGDAGAEDLARLVEALELMDGRIRDLESQVGDLAEGLASVVDYLERQSGEATAQDSGSDADAEPTGDTRNGAEKVDEGEPDAGGR